MSVTSFYFHFIICHTYKNQIKNDQCVNTPEVNAQTCSLWNSYGSFVVMIGIDIFQRLKIKSRMNEEQ